MKRIAFRAGRGPDPITRHNARASEAQLAEEIRRLAEDKA